MNQETLRQKSPAVFTPEQRERLAAWTQRYPYPAMGLVEALRDVQDWLRSVPPAAESHLAELFKLPLNRIHEVATFYPYFTQHPTGKRRIQICRNLTCSLRGAGKMLDYLGSRLATAPDGTMRPAPQAGSTTFPATPGVATPDGLFSFGPAECLGACDHAPALSVNDELIGAASEEVIDRVLDDCRNGRPPRAGSTAFPAAGSTASPAAPDRIGSSNGAASAAAGGRILTAHFHETDLHRLEMYRRLGGYRAWEKAKKMAPGDIVEEVKKSNLRGLGGAGFPSGMKWSTVPSKKERDEPHYLVANADESEPGCFKDRVLMERNPHALIEGLLIAGRAIDADALFIFLRGEYARPLRVLDEALREAKDAGLLSRGVLVMRGADAYISGCDTALLETMEGKKAWPRQPPPFPTASGVMGHPTVVNNVETLMMVPWIIEKGGEAFAKVGVAKSGGTAVFSVSGHVEKPGVYEFPMGTPLKDVIGAAGGVRAGHALKAVIPGGTSTPVLTAAEAERAKMDFDGLRSLGSFLGAGGVVVLDDTADMVEVLSVIERFLAHESCGQCTPCREGSRWIARILERMLEGKGAAEDVDELLRIGDNVTGKVICALGDTVGMVARSYLTKFRSEFEAKVKKDR